MTLYGVLEKLADFLGRRLDVILMRLAFQLPVGVNAEAVTVHHRAVAGLQLRKIAIDAMAWRSRRTDSEDLR
ncbi:hypothetical protein D3C73_1592990 [compost metagenome]